jgi:hypothetical protein
MKHRHHHTDSQPARTPDSLVTDELLSDLLDPSKSVFDICHAHGLTLDELAQATDSERFRRATLLLNHIADRREHALAPLRRERALEALDRIANQQPTTATHTETIRRAAATFAKATKTTESPEPDPATAESIDASQTTESAPTEHDVTSTEVSSSEPRASARAGEQEARSIDATLPEAIPAIRASAAQAQSATPAP